MPHWMMSGPILEAVFGNGDIVAMMNSLKASPNQVLRKAVAKVQAENPGVPTPAPPESSAPLAPETPAPAPAGVPPAPTAPGAPSAPSAPAPAGAMSIDEARRLGLVFNEPIGTSTGERTMPAAAPAPAPAPASENNHFGNFSDKEAAQAHLDSHVGQPGYDNARVVQLKNGKFSVVAPKPVLTPEEKTAWFDVEFPGRASEPQETKVAEYDQLHEKHNVIPSQPRPSAQGVDELMNTTRFRQNAIFDDVRKEFGYGAQLPKDRFTLGHTQRVTALATKLAQEMGLDEGAVARIQDASILHDVGKGNQEYWHLLNKPGKLTPAEYEIMAKHEADSAALVGKSKEYNVLADIVGNHHTAFTKNPPLEAQVIAVSDIYDAVREPRPYKTAMTQDAAIEVLNDLAEKGKLNPDIVNRFVKGLKEGKYEGIGTGRQRFNDYGFLWWGKPITSGVGPDIRYDVTPHLKDLSRGQASPIPTKFLAKAPVRATMVVLDNDGNPHFADDNRQDLGLINPPRKPLNRAQMDVIADALGRAKR
jgi:putative nucleotidyltransferase with HDIG domain